MFLSATHRGQIISPLRSSLYTPFPGTGFKYLWKSLFNASDRSRTLAFSFLHEMNTHVTANKRTEITTVTKRHPSNLRKSAQEPNQARYGTAENTTGTPHPIKADVSWALIDDASSFILSLTALQHFLEFLDCPGERAAPSPSRKNALNPSILVSVASSNREWVLDWSFVRQNLAQLTH